MTTIYPAITTITPGQWRKKIKEIKKLGLTEACFFPTCLNKKQFQEAIQLLKKTPLKKIPLVHLRNDISKQDIDFFVKHYKTEVFNVHATGKYPDKKNLYKYGYPVYIETMNKKFSQKSLNNYAGICLDASHIESERLQKNTSLYNYFIKILKQYPIGCAHVSAINPQGAIDPHTNKLRYDSHLYKNFKQFDYLTRYVKFLPPITALEVENPIAQQLKAIKYINRQILK